MRVSGSSDTDPDPDPGSALRSAAHAATRAVDQAAAEAAGIDTDVLARPTPASDEGYVGESQGDEGHVAEVIPISGRGGWRPLGTVIAVSVLAAVIVVEKAWFFVAWSGSSADTIGPRQALGVRYHGPQSDHGLLPLVTGELAWPDPEAAVITVGQPYDVVVLLLEGARADMLDPAIMPATAALANESLVPTDHRSAGHATRYGLFGMFYGLDASYWPDFLAAGNEPVLLRALREAGYTQYAFSCTNLSWPEFRQTIFSGFDDSRIRDTWHDATIGGRIARDREITNLVVDSIQSQGAGPLFTLGFYDGTHFPYQFREQDLVNTLIVDPLGIDMIGLSRGIDPALVEASQIDTAMRTDASIATSLR